MSPNTCEPALTLDTQADRLRDYLLFFRAPVTPLSGFPSKGMPLEVQEALRALAEFMIRTGATGLTDRDCLMFDAGLRIGTWEKAEDGPRGVISAQRKSAGQRAGGAVMAGMNAATARALRDLVDADKSIDSRTKKLRRAADEMRLGENTQDRTLSRWYLRAGSDKA